MLSRRALFSTLVAAGGATACGSQTAPVAAPAAAADGLAANPVPTAAPSGPATAPTGSLSSATDHTLVVVFQRFAADWINLLVPYGDPDYPTVRPNIQVTNPLVLDDFFGLNPGLSALKPIFDAGRLGFVTATGWMPLEARDRSHFFAQLIAEAGARSGVNDGWLGRVMLRDGADPSNVFAALAAESSVPTSFQGYPNALAVRDFSAYTHGSVMGEDATRLIETLATLAGPPGEGIRRLANGMTELAQNPPPEPSVAYPATTLGQGLKVAAQAIRAGFAPRVISVTSDDDWDTHVNQVSRHAAALPNFAGALAAFHDDLGDHLQKVTLVTMTEFGRKARENFNGTDHGTASSMLVMGGSVAGGRVYGQWPGLAADRLFDGEDLEPTTDFRSVLGEILGRRMGVSAQGLAEIFPGGFASQERWRGFLR